MKCELESRNDGVMAVAPVADNYIPENGVRQRNVINLNSWFQVLALVSRRILRKYGMQMIWICS